MFFALLLAVCIFSTEKQGFSQQKYVKFRPVTLTLSGNQELGAETPDGASKVHPRSVNFFLGYSVFKEGNAGFFGTGSYADGYFFGAAGVKTEFDLTESLIGEEMGDVIARVLFAVGGGFRTKAVGKDKIVWFVKAIAKNPKWELDGTFYGTTKNVSFVIRCGMYAWKILRIGLEAQKYERTTSVAGLFAEGIIPLDKYVGARVGASIGAQVQDQMRFHWVPGIHLGLSAQF
jgi:hypothetical protein